MTTLAKQIGAKRRREGVAALRAENARLRDACRFMAQLLTSWTNTTAMARDEPLLWDTLVRAGREGWVALGEDPGIFATSMRQLGIWPDEGADGDA
jgi:hypothetical protein